MSGDVIVLGAGVVGLTTALALLRGGARVTLVDRGTPGAGCSFGNAGMIQTGSSLPLAEPRILRKVPAMLTDPTGALVLRWRRLPGLVPFGLRLLANARPDRVAANEAAMARLLALAQPAWQRLTAGTHAAAGFRPQGELYLVRGAAAFAGYAAKIAACQRNGVAAEVLDAAAIRAMAPLVSPDFTHGLHLPGSGWVTDPQVLSTRVFQQFLAEGGRFHPASIRRAEMTGGRPELVTETGARLPADRLVIAAGAGSGPLSGGLGPRLPIEPMRGYHITLSADGVPLPGPVIDGEMNIAITPMAGGHRVAGTLEFAGFDPRPNWKRAEMLAPLARRLVPSIDTRIRSRWFGDRPGTPDSLPVIGARRAAPAVWYACGHGMLGLTLAAATAELLAAAMTGDPAATRTLAPCSPDRF